MGRCVDAAVRESDWIDVEAYIAKIDRGHHVLPISHGCGYRIDRCGTVGDEQALIDRATEERVVDSVHHVGNGVILREDRLADHRPRICGPEHGDRDARLCGELLEDTFRDGERLMGCLLYTSDAADD